MEALQYIYTSWKNGDSTEKGYMIYSRSEGISESECTAIKDAMQYLAPKELTLTPTPQEIADIFPYAFSYFVLPTGRGCVAQSTYLGKDYSGRYGNYIIHALIFDINDLPCRPAEFFAEPYIKTAMTQEELDAPSPVPPLPPLHGFIFIIDPLTLNQFAMDVEDKVDLNAYGASSKDFDDILNIMLINLEKMFGLKDKDTLKRNLAVVINKVDIPTLEEKIGETAAQQYLAENAKTCKSYMDARDAVCRNFLEEYGAGNFVRTAEAKFKTVRYFTCSALGHNHEGQPYEGKNVVDPVMWLLQQADSSIKAE